MVTMGRTATTTRGLQLLLHVSLILKEEDIVLPTNNHRSLVEEDIHLWRVESVLGGLELDWVVQRVLGLLHGLFHVFHVLVTFGFVTVERFLDAWYLDVGKVKKTDRFTDILLLLARPDVSIRIQELAQLGQEDMTRDPDNLLDDGGYGRTVGVCLDDATTILDAPPTVSSPT
jgi:hypothetical protein